MVEFIISAAQILGGIIVLAGIAWFVFVSNQILEDKEKQEAEENL